MKRMAMIPAVVLILALVLSPLGFCRDLPQAEKDAGKKAGQMTGNKRQSAPVQPQEREKKEREKKEREKGQTSAASPASLPGQPEKQPAEITPAQPQQSDLSSAPGAKEKGRQIKWQIVCTGGACGNNNQAKGLVIGDDYWVVCGSAGQTAVGPGSSPSFGVNSGYWQETLYEFLRGDANSDGVINVSDAIYLLNYLFRNGPEPDPYALGDANNDGQILVGDAIFLLNYLFRGGPAPEGGPIGRGRYSSVNRSGR
jgi:hypothetical protein